MTELEKALVKCLGDLTQVITDIGKGQASMANFICQHLPSLTDDEKQEMLALAEKTWLQLQSLQDLATKLKQIG